MKNRFLIAFVLLVILSTYTLKSNFIFQSTLNVKNILVENNHILSDEEVKKELSFLYKKNLFFLRKGEIEDKLSKISFIESYELKKVYPNAIKVKIFEKKPVVILKNKKKKYYFTESSTLINFVYLEKFKSLPTVFGDYKNFKILYKSLKETNFPLSAIKTFYLFETKRWDLITKNGITVKLPIDNYKNSLKNFLTINKKPNFKKYEVFDYRIKDQLILK